MGNGDHDNGFGHEYMWWQIQKITDLYHNPPQFVALLAVRQKTPNGPEYGGEKIAQQQKAGYPDIQPLVVNDPPERSSKK